HEEFKERTKVVERVLERRAGEEEATATAERPQRLRCLRAAVFEMLRLVTKDQVEFQFVKELGVARERAVGSDDKVVVGEFRCRQAVRSVVREYRQLRRESGRLTAPVFHQ